MNEKLRALRKVREHAVGGWLSGGTADGAPRWTDDDGRRLTRGDILQMRLDLLENKGSPEQRRLWDTIVASERAQFQVHDAAYDEAKAELSEDEDGSGIGPV